MTMSLLKRLDALALAAFTAFVTSAPAGAVEAPPAQEAPNVVVIFIDDLGYADIGPLGCEAYPTPNLDRMAADGRVFTDFHAATAVCSASRAGLLTGCYPGRVSIQGALPPNAPIGLHPNEVTIAEVCKSKGYATACFGKWHLGDRPEFLPTRQGFDEYFGLPYSNDMWPYPPGREDLEHGKRGNYPPLPLYEGERIVNANVTPQDQTQLTTQYTERAVDFIDRHAGKQPFFLYVPHSMVHVPLYVSEKFAGKSGAGLFGDVMMEVDWSVGEILAALERGGVADDTLVVFTSDNGPWLNFGEHAGSAKPLREGKGTMWEGGYREPLRNALAEENSSGDALRRVRRDDRPLADDCRDDRRRPARAQNRRQGHPSRDDRRRAVATPSVLLLLRPPTASSPRRALEVGVAAPVPDPGRSARRQGRFPGRVRPSPGRARTL